MSIVTAIRPRKVASRPRRVHPVESWSAARPGVSHHLAAAQEFDGRLTTDFEYAARFEAHCHTLMLQARGPLGRPTIAFPDPAQGWSPECRQVVKEAYNWLLDGPCEGIELYDGEVPDVELCDILVGLSMLSSARPELPYPVIMALLAESMRFVGLE